MVSEKKLWKWAKKICNIDKNRNKNIVINKRKKKIQNSFRNKEKCYI